MIFNYNNRKFKLAQKDNNGELSSDIIFEYKQEGKILHCIYADKHVQHGQLLDIVDEKGNIDIRYQQINLQGELRTGTCYSKPELMVNGKIRLHEKWQWTSGDKSHGKSILVEL